MPFLWKTINPDGSTKNTAMTNAGPATTTVASAARKANHGNLSQIATQQEFDFSLFTSIFPSKNNVYYFCHEFDYMPLKEQSLSEGQPVHKVLIIQRQPFKPFDPWQFLKAH